MFPDRCDPHVALEPGASESFGPTVPSDHMSKPKQQRKAQAKQAKPTKHLHFPGKIHHDMFRDGLQYNRHRHQTTVSLPDISCQSLGWRKSCSRVPGAFIRSNIWRQTCLHWRQACFEQKLFKSFRLNRTSSLFNI